MHVIYYLLLMVVMLCGLGINVLGLPGLWLMVAGLGGYAIATGWNHYVGWPSLIALVVLALLAELAEFFAGAAGSKAAGGRTRGMIGAVVGAFLGAIFLSIIPIPVVAQIVGACLGAFVGAAVMEFYDKDLAHAMRVGVGAAKGRFVGIIVKLAFGIVMFIVAAVAAFPHGRPPAPPPPPPPTLSVPPSTLPTTTSTAPSPI